MERNSTFCCNDSVLNQCPRGCPEDAVYLLSEHITGHLWRVESLLLANAILAGILVGVGAYGHRYRHYGFTRYLLQAAATLFLPILSYVVSAGGSSNNSFSYNVSSLRAECIPNILHPYAVMVSSSLVLISGINTSPIVATDDREDRSIHPPFELLVKGIWIVYLVAVGSAVPLDKGLDYLRITPFVLIHAKMVLKSYAFLKARKSFSLGRNPRLIVGYMQQLREGSDQHGESRTASGEHVNVPPPLIVMGEDERKVEKQHNGYMFRRNSETVQGADLVTLDRVWQLDGIMPTPQLKDLCLSFALFKLLRCRFARYKLPNDLNSTKTSNFLRSVMLKDGEHERALRMIADELSFLHDYYDSPLPISYSDNGLTIFSMVITVLSIGYCILSGMDIIRMAYFPTGRSSQAELSTIWCGYSCVSPGLLSSDDEHKEFGSRYFDLVPVLLVLVFVMVAEARDLASHICSSWTKVILTCRCVHRASLQLYPVVPKWVRYLLQCRCNRLMRHWNDKMGQNSLLVFQPSQFHQLVFPGRLLRLLGQKRNNVKVPSAVKVCIINALRSICNNGGLNKGITSLHQSQDGESLLWASNSSKGTSHTILVWHIATTILEVRHPHHYDDPRWQGGHRPSSISEKKIAATHLSRYCAYLVAFCPELLPDDDSWSKDLYKDVKKEARRALATAGGTGLLSMPPEAGYRRLIELLGARQNHDVIKDAVKLAEQLGELTSGGEETAWELLAGFWSEMVLYVAPSDNLNGHMQAIDRGGELITLVWALLTHIGIVDRPESAAARASSSY